jgi:hypothetical protein
MPFEFIPEFAKKFLNPEEAGPRCKLVQTFTIRDASGFYWGVSDSSLKVCEGSLGSRVPFTTWNPFEVVQS